MPLTLVSSNGAYEQSKVIKASPGILRSLDVYSSSGSAQFIQIYDSPTVPTSTVLGVVERFSYSITGQTTATLAGKYFLTEDRFGPVTVTFESETIPAPNVSALPGTVIRVILADADAVATIANKLASAINASPEFVAVRAGSNATVTNSFAGARTNASAGTGPVTPSTIQEGVTPVGIPKLTISVAATSSISRIWPDGIPFTNGISISNSSTGPTRTAGIDDCYFSAVVE